MIFCIDSHVFIWGIKRQYSEHDKEKIDDAAAFLTWIDEEDHTILLPTVVLAECLSQEPIEKQAAIMKIAYESFMVINFDAAAALKYAQVLNLEKFQAAKEKAKDENISREKMKIDYLIVCCAMANGAQRIYSHDKDIVKFATGLIDVQPLPKILKPIQQTLFTPHSIVQLASETDTVQEKGLQVSIEILEEKQNTSHDEAENSPLMQTDAKKDEKNKK